MPPEADPVVAKNNEVSGAHITQMDRLTETTVQIDNKVYNAESLATIHPGGEVFVKAFAGRDATEAFLSYHRRTFPHQKMSEHLVGQLKSTRDAASDDKEYLELCEIVEKVLPRHKSFAPLSYYLKIAVLFSMTVSLECYLHYTATYPVHLVTALGILFALVGMNIQHDANHGAISRKAWVNRFLGTTQNWIGGSALDWIHQHVVQHHITPNDCEKDPDIAGSDLLRLNPLKPLSKIHGMQHIYVFLLFLLFGSVYIAFAVIHIAEGFHMTAFSTLLKQERKQEFIGFALFFLRWLLLPVWRMGTVTAILNTLPLYMAGGYYLAFFFLISHNFDGVWLEEKGRGDAATGKGSAEDEGKTKPLGFLRRQVATASNVGGAWLCFLNGGLNYQIEHHLFPRIQHSHYPKIAPVVRAFCESRGVPYIHFKTVLGNVASCAKHLETLGNQTLPPNFKPRFDVQEGSKVAAKAASK
jgi:fatty acid desaturase (delta-4 desaturase)